MNKSIIEPPNREGFMKLNFFDKRVDWSRLQGRLCTNWAEKLDGKSCQESYDAFVEILYETAKMEVPEKRKTARIIPRDRRLLMKKRSKLRKRLLRSKNSIQVSSIEQQLEAIEEKLIVSHKTELRRKEERAIQNIKNNSKYFYRYAKSKRVSKSSIGPFVISGSYVEDPKAKAEALSKQYCSVFSSVPHDEETICKALSVPGAGGIEDFDFGVAEVVEAINELKENSSPGPDGVPTVLLKRCRDQIAPAIADIWKKSVKEGSIPLILKTGIVSPLHKGGDKTQPNNYRPVTLTSHIIKIFERIVSKILKQYLTKIDVWNENQHGFRQGRSCVSQLLDHYHKIIDALEDEYSVNVIYLDFCKAFDKVDHELLLSKLSTIGIRGNALRWLGNFLIGRKQAVALDGFLSSYAAVGSGVPQGSVIGPLLFLIHIADIDYMLQFSAALSFADDTKLVMKLKNDEDGLNFQKDLESIYHWSLENKMSFNQAKFVHLH